MKDEKLVERLLKKWKERLRIRKSIFWTTDFKEWKKFSDIKKTTFTSNQLFGSIDIKKNSIFINLKVIKQDRASIELTIIHELVHSKFPLFNEKKVEKTSRDLLIGKIEFT